MTLAYRSLEHVVASRYAELAEVRAGEIASLGKARSAYARRVGRIAAGAVGMLGAIYVFGRVVIAIASGHSPFSHADMDGSLTPVLLATWPAAIIAYVSARLVGGAAIDVALARPLLRTGDWTRDLAQLEASSPTRTIGDRASAIERASATLPLVALSFLSPLTLHYACAFVVSAGNVETKAFDEWISASVVIVGHAHLVLALCAWRFARNLTRRDEVGGRTVVSSWLRAYGFTVLAGAIPGALLLLVPPVLVAITGIAFIPFMYVIIERRIAGERLLLTSRA